MQTIKFGHNWNQKILCKYFTTLRLHQPERYAIGNTFEVYLKTDETPFKVVEVVAHKRLKMDDINEYIAGLDTGYTVDECKKILRRMYSNVDWSTQLLSFVLFKTISTDP